MWRGGPLAGDPGGRLQVSQAGARPQLPGTERLRPNTHPHRPKHADI